MKPGTVIKTFQSKKGNDVIIRYIRQEDLDDMLAYANTLVDEDTFVGINKKITRKEESKYLAEALKKIEKEEKIHLAVEVGGKFAGSAEVRRRDRRQAHVGEIGISLGREFRQEGIGTELFSALIDEAKKLGLRLLILYCFEINTAALGLYEKLGFQRAGIVPGMFAYKGKFESELTMYLPLV